ncbi:MAG: acyl-CoA dehydrogenase family protein [Acidimicrobiales bacterium]
MIDFEIPADLAELRDRTAAFIREQIIPLEQDAPHDHHGPTEEFRLHLVGLARDAGLLVPHVSKEFGGLGLSHVGKALIFEESGYSMLGPVAMHIAAPDEGNMHLLEVVANADQKERFLRPVTSGQHRSMFMMTEPEGGAGSDPSMMKTRADEQADGSYKINGLKWLITSALGPRWPSSWPARSIAAAPTWAPPCSSPSPDAGHRDRRGARHDGPQRRRRPRGDQAERRPPAGRVGAGRGGRRLPLRPGAARPGPSHPLHALAGRRPPLPRRGGGLRPHPPRLRQADR